MLYNREDPSQLEMSFDLGHYQPSLRPRYVTPPVGTTDAVASSSSSVIPSPIYQSIFLDKGSCESSWTWKRIDPAKVLLVKWWRQFSHEVSHFLRVVPFVRLIQGTLTSIYEGVSSSFLSSFYRSTSDTIYLYSCTCLACGIGSVKSSTYYCGSWTLVNTHEIAVISGLAAAHQLGAGYPFEEDELATLQFDSYLSLAHGASRRTEYYH